MILGIFLVGGLLTAISGHFSKSDGFIAVAAIACLFIPGTLIISLFHGVFQRMMERGDIGMLEAQFLVVVATPVVMTLLFVPAFDALEQHDGILLIAAITSFLMVLGIFYMMGSAPYLSATALKAREGGEIITTHYSSWMVPATIIMDVVGVISFVITIFIAKHLDEAKYNAKLASNRT